MSESSLDDMHKKAADYVQRFWYEQPEEIKSKISLAFRAGYNSKDEWISVEDRLPEVGEMVITFPYSMITIRHTKVEDGDTKWFFDALPVTHWQPLPEPPKK